MNRKNKIKWGVIGSGGIARRRTIPEGIMPADNAELIAVYGTNRTTNEEVAAEFKATATDSVEALLASDIDAVYIASPVRRRANMSFVKSRSAGPLRKRNQWSRPAKRRASSLARRS
jgi:predicted dehydrogenase